MLSSIYRKTLVILISGCSMLSTYADKPAIASEHLKFFEDKIRPVLADQCYKCHSEKKGKRKGGLLLDRKAGWETGGDSGGSVINLSQPKESLLVKMIEHDPDYEPMPPKRKLSKSQIADFIKWIEMGAPDPRDQAIGKSKSHDEFDLVERSKWWSFQPLKKSPIPQVRNKDWPINAYDNFLLSALEDKGWKPAEPTNKATLLRRASITLTGLSPTVKETENFLQDKRPDAYERQIDRLLSSPHYGERFARHWMDVARYADSKAFENDYTIPYGNEYRDYLIRAFNDDIPYDQFVKEAFAGDLLKEPRINSEKGINESLIGPSFLLSTDGHHGPPDLHEDEARIFDGMINTATVAFQGLTVSCAKCHDHKFDAITAADYYSLYGVLRSSRLHYANASHLSSLDKNTLTQLKELKPKIINATLKSANDHSDELSEIIELAIQAKKIPSLNNILKQKKLDDRKVLIAAMENHSGRKFSTQQSKAVESWYNFLWKRSSIPELAKLRQKLTQQKAQSTSYQTPKNFRWNTTGQGFQTVTNPEFIVDFNHPGLIRSGISKGTSSGLTSARVDGAMRTQDFILDGKKIQLWVRGRNASVNLIIRNYELVGRGPTTKSLRVNIDSDHLTKVTFDTKLWKGEPAYLEVLHHGRNLKCLAPKEGLGRPSDNAYVTVVENFDSNDWSYPWDGPPTSSVTQQISQLIDRALKKQLHGADSDYLGALFAANLIPLDLKSHGLPTLLKQARDLQNTLPKPRYVRSLVEGQLYDEPVYIRGSHKQLSKKPNPKHYLDAFGGIRIGENSSGRLEYAHHMVTTTDFLTARVRVNRIWTRIFGRGIVSSVDDFGKMGAHPSHPELLDYLANRFIQEGWSTKKIIRELMTSRTYRMSSIPSKESLKEDPTNTFLQHMPLQRMDAESVRDHILFVSGALKRDLYGPTIDMNTKDQLPSRGIPRNGPLDGKGRRSIYQVMRRNFLPTFQRAFNLPDPSAPVGQRQVTNVPAQSLTLLNHPFVHQQAEIWAKRITTTKNDLNARIHTLHKQAFSRPASEKELLWAKQTLQDFLSKSSEIEAWTSLCHIMINRKEFIYVF